MDAFTPADSPIAKLIRDRRTIHTFKPEQPPQELLLQAIELARWAPNHHRTEPWKFLLPGPLAVSRIIELNARLVEEKKGAAAAEAKRQRWSEVPGWLVITCQSSENPVTAREDYAACCCAIQNLSLFLWSVGVGVKWTSGDVIRHPEFLPILNLNPAREEVVGLIWYGYPAQIPEQQRADLNEIVHWHD